MQLIALERILPLVFCLSAAPALKAQTPPCALTAPKLSYPEYAIANRLSGPVAISFVVDERGAPRDLEAQGDSDLSSEVKSAYRYLRFPRPCIGKQVSILVKFRIDPNLPLEKPVAINQISETEYELVSPAKDLVVLADPAVLAAWPGAIPIEIRHVGDDGLTVRLSDALERRVEGSHEFSYGNEGKRRTLVVTVPKHVAWKELGSRTQIRYAVEFTTDAGPGIGRSEGVCWEDAAEKCARHILRDAKRLAKSSR